MHRATSFARSRTRSTHAGGDGRGSGGDRRRARRPVAAAGGGRWRPGPPRRRVEVQRALVEPADPAAPRPTLGLIDCAGPWPSSSPPSPTTSATFHDGTTVERIADLEPGRRARAPRHRVPHAAHAAGTAALPHRHRQRRPLRRDRGRPHRRQPARAGPPVPRRRAAVPGDDEPTRRPRRWRAADLAAVDRQGRPLDRRHRRGVRRVRGVLPRRRSAIACTSCAATTTPTAGRTTTPATSGSTCPASPSPCSTRPCRRRARAPDGGADRLAGRRRRRVDGAGARDGPPPAVGLGRNAAAPTTSASTPTPATR